MIQALERFFKPGRRIFLVCDLGWSWSSQCLLYAFVDFNSVSFSRHPRSSSALTWLLSWFLTRFWVEWGRMMMRLWIIGLLQVSNRWNFTLFVINLRLLLSLFELIHYENSLNCVFQWWYPSVWQRYAPARPFSLWHLSFVIVIVVAASCSVDIVDNYVFTCLVQSLFNTFLVEYV